MHSVLSSWALHSMNFNSKTSNLSKLVNFEANRKVSQTQRSIDCLLGLLSLLLMVMAGSTESSFNQNDLFGWQFIRPFIWDRPPAVNRSSLKGTSLTERLLQKSECITVTNWTPNGWQQDLDFTEVISDIQTKVTLGSEKHFQRVPGRIFPDWKLRLKTEVRKTSARCTQCQCARQVFGNKILNLENSLRGREEKTGCSISWTSVELEADFVNYFPASSRKWTFSVRIFCERAQHVHRFSNRILFSRFLV